MNWSKISSGVYGNSEARVELKVRVSIHDPKDAILLDNAMQAVEQLLKDAVDQIIVRQKEERQKQLVILAEAFHKP
jgi:hypothetical protein